MFGTSAFPFLLYMSTLNDFLKPEKPRQETAHDRVLDKPNLITARKILNARPLRAKLFVNMS